MTVGERIEERRKALNIESQSALARSAGVGQSTLNGLIRKPYRWSPYLPQIARALRTTVDYLVGDTEDPAPDALIAERPPSVLHVMLPVALPSENALARMFEGVLEVADMSAPPAALARELAQLLPTALSALKGPLTEIEIGAPPRRAARAAALATADRGSSR